EALAAMDREDRVAALAELGEPVPLRPRPLVLVARRVEAREGRVGCPGQETAVAKERLRLVEGLERAVRREPAFEVSALAQFVERFHAVILADRWARPRS